MTPKSQLREAEKERVFGFTVFVRDFVIALFFSPGRQPRLPHNLPLLPDSRGNSLAKARAQPRTNVASLREGCGLGVV